LGESEPLVPRNVINGFREIHVDVWLGGGLFVLGVEHIRWGGRIGGSVHPDFLWISQKSTFLLVFRLALAGCFWCCAI
jgi:hypothetical protein